MPKMVTCKVNPDFKPKTDEDKALLADAKKRGAFKTTYQTAIKNVQLSGGMFKIEEVNEAPKAAPQGPDLESLSPDDLKVMLASLGIKTEKMMKRSDAIGLIRRKLDAIEIVDE